MSPSMRDTDDSWHDGIGDLDRNLDRASARSNSSHLPVSHAKASSIVGMHMECAAFFALREDMEIVHPGVIGTQVAPAYEEHVFAFPGHILLKSDVYSLYIVHHRLRSQLDFARRRAQYFRDARLERAEINAMRMGFQHCQAQPILSAKPVAVWAAAQ